MYFFLYYSIGKYDIIIIIIIIIINRIFHFSSLAGKYSPILGCHNQKN